MARRCMHAHSSLILTADSDDGRELWGRDQVRDRALRHPIAQRDGEKGFHVWTSCLTSTTSSQTSDRRFCDPTLLRWQLQGDLRPLTRKQALCGSPLTRTCHTCISTPSSPPFLVPSAFAPSRYPSPWHRPATLSPSIAAALAFSCPAPRCCPGPPLATQPVGPRPALSC
jgi:hypothetical protein